MTGRGTSPTGLVNRRAAVVACQGLLRVSYRENAGSTRVLYAVPRAVGGAVVRNRVRRRLRESLRTLIRDGDVVLGRGEYLLAVSSPLEHVSASELRDAVAVAVRGANLR